jgi:hypothetical protein
MIIYIFFLVSLISNILYVLTLHLPMVRVWWLIAVVQSEHQPMSRCNSKCHSSESSDLGLMKSVLFDQMQSVRIPWNGHPTTFLALLLLLSGDVETNPGPRPGTDCAMGVTLFSIRAPGADPGILKWGVQPLTRGNLYWKLKKRGLGPLLFQILDPTLWTDRDAYICVFVCVYLCYGRLQKTNR